MTATTQIEKNKESRPRNFQPSEKHPNRKRIRILPQPTIVQKNANSSIKVIASKEMSAPTDMISFQIQPE